MASTSLEVVSGSGEEAVSCEIRPDLDKLLDRGLSPQQVAQQYFAACWQRKPELWLATLHIERRAEATSSQPGPFDTCNWELGRARVEKYMVQYQLMTETSARMENSEPTVVLQYQPTYGPVPGYKAGAPLGPTIELRLRQQGGASGEWRVVSGYF